MNRSFRLMMLALVSSASLTGSALAQHFTVKVRLNDDAETPRTVRTASHRKVAAPAPKVIREVQSELGADAGRAKKYLRVAVEKTIAQWLAEDGVPLSWNPPKRMIDRAITGQVYVEPVQVEDLTVYRATVETDFSPARKRAFIDAFHRQEGGRRLAYIGGGLAFVLACLAGVSGYIRADEATKGYYTNRLRLLAAASVGAAGVAVYQILT